MRNNLPVLNVYKKNSKSSEIVTQLLYGDNFKKIRQFRSWIKIKNNSDSYKGYIKNKNFPKSQINTHKVCVLYSKLYSKPNNRSKIKKNLALDQKLKL